MSNCVCGKVLPVGNKFCCYDCYLRFNDCEKIPEIVDNLNVGGDKIGS